MFTKCIVYIHIDAELKAYWVTSCAYICSNVESVDYSGSTVGHTYAMFLAYLFRDICQ